MTQDKSQQWRVGWIGTGRMGFEMAARLAQGGADLTVWNRTRAKAEPLSKYGAKIADELPELAACDVVFCMVSTWDDVRQVIAGPSGLLSAGGAAPRMVVECSSISLEGSAELRALLATRGIELLAAPVSGNAKVIKAGRLSFVCSGPRAAFEAALPYLRMIAPAASYVGEGELARMVKICHNVFLGVVTQSLAEITVLLPLNIYWIMTDAGLIPIVLTILLAKLVSGSFGVVAVHRRVTRLERRFESETFRYLWKTLLPFGVASIIVFPSVRLDILILSKMTSVATVGLYAAASKPMELLFTLPMAFFMVMLPRTSSDLVLAPDRGAQRLRVSLAWYFALVVPLAVGIITFADPLVRLIYGHGFGGAVLPLQVLMLALVVLSADVVFAMICKAAGFQRVDLSFVLTTTLVSVLLYFVLVPYLATLGAASAVLVAATVGFVLRCRFVHAKVMRVAWV